jgi:hypothetical protein
MNAEPPRSSSSAPRSPAQALRSGAPSRRHGWRRSSFMTRPCAERSSQVACEASLTRDSGEVRSPGRTRAQLCPPNPSAATAPSISLTTGSKNLRSSAGGISHLLIALKMSSANAAGEAA